LKPSTNKLLEAVTVMKGQPEDLFKAWMAEYFERDALKIFKKKKKSRSSEAMFNGDCDYTKVIAIVQSSSMGKSRMVDELLKQTPVLVYVMCKPKEAGYPPGDSEVYCFLRESNGTRMEHAVVVAVIAALVIEGKLDILALFTFRMVFKKKHKSSSSTRSLEKLHSPGLSFARWLYSRFQPDPSRQ
jgi:hypothetical protein